MICNLYFLGIRFKMNNPQLFIPSHGLDKIYLDLSNMYWYMYKSSYYNLKKEIPFFNFLLNLGSLGMRCYTQLNVRPNHHNLFNRILMLDVAKRSTYFIQSFIKIQSLTEDLFCTGEIETLDYCMEVCQQFIDEEELDFFISDSQELKLALPKLRDELLNFEFYLDELLVTLYFFLPKEFKENLDKTKEIFLIDLQDQF